MTSTQLDQAVITKLADALKQAQAQAVGLQSGPGQPPEAVGFFFHADTDDDLWLALASHCQVYLELSGEEKRFLAAISALQAENRRLRQQAVVDRASGLYTRTYFEEALETEATRMDRFRLPLSLMLIKLKSPKSGGPGSRVFNATAGLVLKHRRCLDQAARYQRNILALIMPDTSQSQALAAARRLRAMIAESWAELAAQDAAPAIAGAGEALIGLAEASPGQAKGAQRLLAEARAALRQAARHEGIWPNPGLDEPETGTTIEVSEKEALFAGFRELTGPG